MTQPFYYVKKDPATDLTFLNAIGGSLEAWLTQASGAEGGTITKTLRIAGKAGVGSQVTEEFLDIIINGSDHSATIAGSFVDLAAEGAIEEVARQIALKGSLALGLGLTGLWVGIVASVVAEFSYSYFLEPTVNDVIDTLLGTVDIDIQIRGANGETLAGVMYKDGLPTSVTLMAAIEELLVSPHSYSEYPVADETMTIAVYRGGSEQPSDIFQVYDGSIAERAAQIIWAGDISSFIAFAGNDAFYSEALINGEVKRWIYARTVVDGVSQNLDNPLDSISVPFPVGDETSRSFHPNNIFIADGSGRFNTNAGESYARLYLGDGADSVGVFKAQAGSGNDLMYGAGGNDELLGAEGDDWIFGDYGSLISEQTYTDFGNDVLTGGRGKDHMFGGRGDDTLIANNGLKGLEGDFYSGGSQLFSGGTIEGIDTLDYSNVALNIGLVIGNYFSVDLHPDNTIVFQVNNSGQQITQTDKVDLVDSIDKFILTSQQDWVTVKGDGYNLVSLDGGASVDTLDLSDLSVSADVNVASGHVTTGVTFQIEQLINFENFIGTYYNDTFVDGAGTQTYHAGLGLDSLSFGQSSLRTVVNIPEGYAYSTQIGAGYTRDYFFSIEGFLGTVGNDYFYALEGMANAYFNGGSNSYYIDGNNALVMGRDIVDFRTTLHDASNPIGVTISLGSDGTGSGSDQIGGSFAFVSIEQIIGSQGHDDISTGGGANWLFGWDGNDTLSSGMGDDHLSGGSGLDILDGGSGNDTYYFGWEGIGGADTIIDADGEDKIYYMEQYQFDPGSYIRDVANNNLVIYGTAVVQGLNTIEHVEYADRAIFEVAGLGLTFSHNFVEGQSIQYFGTNLPETILGQNYDDQLIGGNESDSISGNAGNDILIGGFGSDFLFGGEGSDSIFAGQSIINNADNGSVNFLFGEIGHDFLYGSGGGDNLYGGEGYDYLSGQSGDFLFGEAGEDQLYGTGAVVLDGGIGNDFLSAIGEGAKYLVSEGRDVILDFGGSSTLVFDSGSSSSLEYYKAANDSLLIVKPDGEYVIIQNYYGMNPLEYISFDEGQSSILISTLIQEIEYLNSYVTLDTGDVSYVDTNYTGGTEDNIYRHDGADHIIYSGLGLNTYVFDYSTIYNRLEISGGVDSQQDLIILQDINSIEDVSLIYENGTMTLFAGNLEIVINDATQTGQSTHTAVRLSAGQTYTLSQLELQIIGSSGDLNGYSIDDNIRAQKSGSTLNGLTGNDFLYGDDGNDVLNGGTGNDYLSDGAGNDVLRGGVGSDLVRDSDGNDTFYVDQFDTLQAGAGFNTLRVDEVIMGSNGPYDLSGLNIELADYESVDEISFVRTFDQNNNNIYTLEYGGNTLLIDDYRDLLSTPTITLTGSNLQVSLEDLVLVTDNREREGFYLFVEPLNYISQDDLFYLGHDGNIVSMIAGYDTVIGGDGQDYITMFTNEGDTDSLEAYGGGGNDYLWSAYGDDHLDGQDGNDTLVAGYGNDFVYGGAGDDTITVEPDGVDFIDGGEGSDTLSYSPYVLDTLLTTGITVDLAERTVLTEFGSMSVFGIENVVGTDLEDIIIGDDGNNILDGLAGEDKLEGGLGDDTYVFFVEYGNDEIEEEGGADTISFLVDQQTLLPYLIITQEHNDLRLEIVDSVLTIKNHFSSEDSQVETLKFSDGSTLDLLDYLSWYVPVEPQEFEGTATADVFVGTQTLGELVDYSFSIEGVLINLQNSFASGGYAEGDILYYIDHVIGSAFADFIAGNPLNNILDGGAGDDQLSGGAGDDSYVFDIGDGYNTVIDTSGFDTLVLGQGISFEDITFTQTGNDLDVQIASGFLLKDFFAGDPDLVVERIQFYDGSTFDLTSLLGASPDDEFTATAAGETFDGGEGSDTVDYSFSTQKVTIDLQNGTASGGFAQGDILISIENIIGTDIANAFDTLYGNNSVNTLLGLAGDDILEGGAGADILDGGAGKDTVRYLRSTSAVSVNLQTGVNTGGDAEGDSLLSIENLGGSAYDDVLIGDSNVNYLNGSLGNDTLDGQGGAGDSLHGEHGNDTYIFTSGYAFMNESTGIDRIVFSADWQPDEVIVNGNFISFEGSMDSITVNDISLFEEFEFTGFGAMNLAALVALNPDAPDTYGDANDNTFTAAAGPEAFYGLGGTDTVSYENSSVAIFIDLVKGSGQYGLAERDTYYDIENIIGSDLQSAADTIYGNSLNNHIYGLAGNDVLEGGAGADTLDGGAGTDWARYIRSTAGVNINLETGVHTGGDAQGDTLINIERIAGSGYSDVLTGSSNAEYLNGGAGNDIVNGRGGADELYGQGGADKFIFDIIDGSTDIISDFKVSENDVIDLHELFTVEYDPLQHAINDFVQITTSGNNSYLSVDVDGGGDNFVQVAAIKLVTGLNASALYESDHLILTESQL